MLLAMLLTGCRLAKVERMEVDMPELVFPPFPVLEGAVRNADGTVTVSGEWLVRLAEYRIRIEETENDYRDIRDTLSP